MNESIKHRVADQIIADYVDSGKLKPGDKLPTVRELKDIYKTSDTTVQHALNILELWGLVRKRHGSGSYLCEPNSMQNGQRAKMIGCISSFADNDIAVRMYVGIEKVCRKNAYCMIVANTQDNYESEREQVKRMVDMGCQAIVLYPVPRTAEQLRNDYLRNSFKDFPIVLIDNAFPEQGVSQVVFDNRLAGRDMAEMLIKEGHKRIAFMSQDNNLQVRSVRDRHKGFLEALQDHGIEFKEEDHWIISSSESVYSSPQESVQKNIEEKLAGWRKSKDHPTAAIAVEDMTAIYTINVAQDFGIKVPDELRVVGFDDLSVARLFRPSFPTTSPDFARAGSIAAEMAIEQAKRGDPARSSVFINTLPVPIKRRKA
ncbi:MAG: GntR family transcriptional regulator [Armatimonadota bacterium]|nr:GntR family transcriptional regulator [bacterium]